VDSITEPIEVKRVSYSQFSTYSTCGHQYQLKYIDKLGTSSGNINTIFGSSCHSVLQEYLTKMFEVTKVAANKLDLESRLMEEMKLNFSKEMEMQGGIQPATKEEMIEFYSDGCLIIDWFRKNISKFYSKKYHKLIGIELPLNVEIRKGIHFIGYIDVILKDEFENKIIIVDLKTSTKGWSKWQKEDPIKKSQLLLYKKFYSEIHNVPIENIDVEYHILKRKLYESTEYTIPRISKFIPPNGKISVNKAYTMFQSFIDDVFDENGNYKNVQFPKKVGKHCEWCEFLTAGICDGKI
jgi:RecB family exonuclease